MAHALVGKAVPLQWKGLGSNPLGGNLLTLWLSHRHHGGILVFVFFVFFCVLILSPLLGIIENAGVT